METPKTPLTEEQKTRRRAGRTLARALWNERVRAQSGEAPVPDRRAAWKAEARAETRRAMKLIRALEKNGFALIRVAPAGTEGAEAGDAAARPSEAGTA